MGNSTENLNLGKSLRAPPPETRGKTPAKISPLKGQKFSFISIMTTKLILHIIEETCIA